MSDEEYESPDVGIGGIVNAEDPISSSGPSFQPLVEGSGSNEENPFACPSALLKRYAKGPFQPKKPLLQFVTNLDKGKITSGGTRKYQCHICKIVFRGIYTRIESHLTGTIGLGVRACGGMNRMEIAEIHRLVQEANIRVLVHPTVESSSSASAAHRSSHKKKISYNFRYDECASKKREVSYNFRYDECASKKEAEADEAVAQFFFAHGLPFRIAQSPYFKEAFINACKAGPSYVAPGEHSLRTTLLDKQYSKYRLTMEKMTEEWLFHHHALVD